MRKTQQTAKKKKVKQYNKVGIEIHGDRPERRRIIHAAAEKTSK